MKFSVLIVAQACVLLSASVGQAQRYTVYGKPGFSGSYTRIGGARTGEVPFYVQLPLHWVDNLEYTEKTSNTINFPASGTGGSWSCGATNYGPYTADSAVSLQRAINDAETCRTYNDSGTQINIPAGHVFSQATGLTLPQTAGDTSTNFIVLTSTNPLPAGRTACSHGIQDNLAQSMEPGIRNPGCNGTALSYQLADSITSVSGAFTLANGTATNASAYNDIASLWTLECTQANCIGISTVNADANGTSPHHYAILNAEVRPVAGLTSSGAPVKLGKQTETAVSQLPSHIHLAYDYFHGDWTDAPVSGGMATAGPTGTNRIANGVYFAGCNNCSLAYSYLDRMIIPGSEGHAILLEYAQQIKIVHNWVEGESIGLFSGGVSDTITIPGFVPATDVEDRANRYTYPYSWLLAQDAGLCVNGLACSGNGYGRKNSHELKAASRYLYDGNINENVDGSGGQSGIILSWKTTNAGGGGQGNYWFTNENVTFTNNILRNGCQGGSWGFRSINSTGNGGGVTLPTQLTLWQNNLTYNIDLSNPGCGGVSPIMGFRVNNNDGNTWAASCTRDSSGLTSTCTLTSAAGVTQSNMNVGDPVNVTACTDTTFNTPATGLTLALSGTVPSGLNVVYPNSGTPNVSSSGCTFNNIQGWPRYLMFDHNSEFVASGANDPYITTNASPLPLSRNMSFTNSIFVNGGPNSTFGEGTRTLTKAFDGASLIFHHLLFAGRDPAVTCPGHTSPAAGGIAACYGQWDTIGVQTTPTAVWGTQSPHCAGSPSSGCIGVAGGVNTGSLSINLSDYHGYALATGSIFKAGQVNQASDRKDLGANIWEIDKAQTATKYLCHSVCGSGPFLDGYVPE